MARKDQVKPLAPAAVYGFRSDEDEVPSAHFKLRQRKYLKCCGCAAAIFLIQAVVILILLFTVFRVKNPTIRMNRVTVTHRPEIVNGSLRQDMNVTLLADISVKNPNVASFRFSNTTTTLYYSGTTIGEGRTQGGKAPAHRTLRLNMTVDVIPAKLTALPSFNLVSSALTVESYTKVCGRVKIMGMIKKNVALRLNCTITYNITTAEVQEDCRRHVSF